LINLCSTNPCQNNGTCVMLGPNTFVCQCTGLWTGTYCSQYVSSCTQSYCSNGGTCYELAPGSPSCYCPSCFTGSLCQQPLDLCNPSNLPCLNNGYCVSNLPYNCSYTCSCTPGNI
jgi:Notch-like protein